jgi:hypothetical protein
MQNRAFAIGGRLAALTASAAAALTIAIVAHAAPSVPALDSTVRASLSPQAQTVNQDAKVMAEFTKRVNEYMEVHRRLERSLPDIPKDATPQQIDTHQRQLEKLIQGERLKAREGYFFDKATRALFRRHLNVAFSGPDGADAKAEIMDEYPGPVRIVINGRYPDTIPLSTVPPKALALLPPLPEELEYRFIGDRLILLDVHAHIVLDAIDKAFRK